MFPNVGRVMKDVFTPVLTVDLGDALNTGEYNLANIVQFRLKLVTPSGKAWTNEDDR